MKHLLFFLASLSIPGMIQALDATRQITGTVIDANDGKPLAGVTVRPADGGAGTLSDHEGHFAIQISDKTKRLQFSYVGMQSREEPVREGEPLEIVMTESGQQLSEVVVTALGISRERKVLGYAVQDIKGDDMNKAGTTSLASALQGKVSGIDIRPSSGAPGASAQIQIRGARSFSDSNTPLVVVDGMPIYSEPDYSTGNSTRGANKADRLIDINPEEIENISVLKGQAAAALYGIRASNGVVLVTTKQGKGKMSKPRVTVSTNISAQTPSRRFRPQQIHAQGLDIDHYNPNTAVNWGPRITDLPKDVKYGGDAQGYPGMYFNPKLESAGLSGWTYPSIYDNVGDYFLTGLTENTNLSISQRTDRASYAFGLGNSYQKGIVPGTGMNRWNARGRVDWSVAPGWNTGFSGNYVSSRITTAPEANNAVVNSVYQAPAEYDLKGTPTHVPGMPESQISYRPVVYDNPYWEAENNEYLQHTNRFFGNAWGEYTHSFGDAITVKIREQAGIDAYTSNYSDVMEVGSAGSKGGAVTNYGVSRNTFNNLLTATLAAHPGAFDIDVMAGNEIDQTNSRYWNYYGSNFNFYGMPEIGNATNLTSSEYTRRHRTVGFFGSVGVGWLSRLFLNVTGRGDYVSTMPQGHRAFFYPSVSLGWVFSETGKLKEFTPLDFGKIRVSYAQVGQAGSYRDNYLYTPKYGGGMYTYYPFTYPVDGVSSYVPYTQIYDPGLTPQNTRNVEFGIDLNWWNGRLKVDYTAAYQDVRDQIFSVPTAGSTGYLYLVTNAGKICIWSHEFNIEGILLQHRDYDLRVGVNFTTVDNKVVELAPGVESIMLGGFTSPQVRAEAGHTYPSIYGTAFQRAGDGSLLLNNGLPQATASSEWLADCQADFVMGFNLTAHYKSISLGATLSWQSGGRMYHGSNLTLDYSGATKESLAWHEGSFIAEGIDMATGKKNTIEVPRQKYYQAYNNVTEAGVYDMSFLKLRDVTLSYTLPRIGPFEIELYGFARNVLLWAAMPNFDPESSQGNGNMGGYFERFSLPATSSYGGGLKFSF